MALLEQLSGVSGPEQAEIELARSRVRSAADLLKLLPELTVAGKQTAPAQATQSEPMDEKMPESHPATEGSLLPESVREPVSESKTEPGPEQKPVTEPMPGPEKPPEPEPMPGPEPLPKPEPRPEPLPKPEPRPEPEHLPDPVKAEVSAGEHPKQREAGRKGQESSKVILADRFIPSGTIGEKISPARKDEVISSVMHNKPIADIGAAIGINDRFYYIRELFSGDALAYSDTIRRLNAAASLGEAMKILDESTVMGSDPAAQSSFVDVVRRKFSLHV